MSLDEERTDLAGERTQLAGERTQLAWWRTGLTAIAVGIGVGRILPMLDPAVASWPYLTLGAGFVIYGIILMRFGNRRGRGVVQSGTDGGPDGPAPVISRLVTGTGIALGIATLVVILFAR